MNLSKSYLILTLLFLTFSLSACNLLAPADSIDHGQTNLIMSNLTVPAASPSQIQADEDIFPPLVLQTDPLRDEEVTPETPISIVFDQAMDQTSVEAAFSISPAIAGDLIWDDEQSLLFRPTEAYQRGQRYKVVIDATATSQAGLTFNRPFELTFTVAGFLAVASTQPEDLALDVGLHQPITILFNRPVVPLSDLDSQADLPQPLTFKPVVEGQGLWLNTSIYQFIPSDQGFAPSTTYTAIVSEDLSDSSGNKIAEAYVWDFITIAPAVAASYPNPGSVYVRPTSVISVAFNQFVDQMAIEEIFSLQNTKTDDVVPGTFTWFKRGLAQPQDPYSFYDPYSQGQGPPVSGVETLMFEPSDPLELNTVYAVSMNPEEADSLSSSHQFTFRTVPPLQVTSTFPEDGITKAPPFFGGLEVSFSAPVDPATIKLGQSLMIQPPVSATQVYSYFWDSNTHLNLNFPVGASSAYTVTLGADIASRDGDTLGQDLTIQWGTRAHDPQVFLHSAGRVGTYKASNPALAYLSVRNVGLVHLTLYALSEDEFMNLNGQNSWQFGSDYRPESEPIRTWQVDSSQGELNSTLIYETNLAGDAETLEPGLYYLIISADWDSIYPEALGSNTYLVDSSQMFVLSDYNLTFKYSSDKAMTWLTDLDQANPVPGADIRIHTEQDLLAFMTTDADGIAYGEHESVPDTWLPRFAFSEQPFAVAVSEWRNGIESWQFNIPAEYYQAPSNAYFYTDRNIYRPGQTVYYKGVIRHDDDASYTLPPFDAPVDIVVFDSQGKEIWQDTLFINENGSVYGQVDLADEAALGIYRLEARYQYLEQDAPATENGSVYGQVDLADEAALGIYRLEARYQYLEQDAPATETPQYFGPGGPATGTSQYFGTDFQVAEYKPPEYLVAVTTDKAEYLNGETITLTAQANYFFGGALAEAEVRYNILSGDHFFRYDGLGFYDFTDYDFSRSQGDFVPGFGELIEEGMGMTDAAGHFTVTVSGDIAERLTSQGFTLEATITDPDSQQVVSNRTDALVHKGEFYIGLRPERYVSLAGTESAVNLITVDWDSLPVAEQEVKVIFNEHNWYSVQVENGDGGVYWESVVEDVPVFTTTVTTDEAGLAVANFVPAEGGIYKVEAQSLDKQGNLVRSSSYMWVSGGSYINWRQENNDRLDLVTDKREYQVGDTATVLIPHPYSGTVQALVTLERGQIYDHQVLTLESNSEQIEIEITADMLPNMFVSVVILKASDAQNPLPSFKIGYAQLPISVAEKEIIITLRPDKAADETYRPRDEVTYDITAQDSEGNPVAAEFSLALLDKAVLSLSDDRQGTLLNRFWRERGLAVQTALGLSISAERVNERVAALAKGGGGGGFDDAFNLVRGEFKDTAFWVADFETDEDGQGSVTTTLPDNLTTWVLIARGVSQDTLVGDDRVEIVSTKPILVRPIIPRFFVVNDQAELKMIVQNNTPEEIDLTTIFEGVGVDLMLESDEALADITLEAGAKTTLRYPVKVDAVDQATLRFGAKASDYEDAIEITLPVHRFSTLEVGGIAGVIDETEKRLEGIALGYASSSPVGFDPTQGNLSVSIAPSLAAGMREGLKYLEHFPYECTEQTVSRFLPNIVTYRAYQELGLDNPSLGEKLPSLVSTGLQGLYAHQNPDGGWGWFGRDRSNPNLSAYVVLGMVEAVEAGFAIDQEVLFDGIQFLQRSLLRPADVDANWRANQQAFVLYVLAEADQGDLGRTILLFEHRALLDHFGQAYLALALSILEPEDDTRVQILLNEITSAAIVSATAAHWEEAETDFHAMNTDIRSTAIILAALSRLNPHHTLAPNVVRWLMSAREANIWATTQETAWSVIALTDWLAATGELEGEYSWQVAINGDPVRDGQVSAENIDQTESLSIAVADLLADEVNRLVIEKDSGLGRLYYTAHLEYYKLVEEVKALDRGIIVARKYSLAGDEDQTAIDEAKVGDIIDVTVTIIAPNSLRYLMVEDPIPAGAEGIDTSLQTTSILNESPELSNQSDPRGWGWWWFNHTELRDEKAALFATHLPKGTYEYTYQIRAALPGEYHVIPTQAEQMYFPEVFGHGEGMVFKIRE